MKKRNYVQGLLTGTLLLGLVGCGGVESAIVVVDSEESVNLEVENVENKDDKVEEENKIEETEDKPEEIENKVEEIEDKGEEKEDKAEEDKKLEELVEKDEVLTEPEENPAEIEDKTEETEKIEPVNPSENNTKDWQPTNLYVPDEELMDFIVMESRQNVTSPEELFALWEEACGVDTGAELLSFDGTTLDFSVEFEEFINKYGSSGEYMYINGLVSTFKEYETVSELYITIEGNIMVTGHSYYDFPL